MISALEIHGVPVLAVEGGAVGLASANKNGTVDYGPMQINSIWLSKIRLYGYTQHQLQYDPCVNVKVGAWILSQNIANAATTWRGVGSYHSHTAILNQQYQTKVSEVYQLLANYLS